MNVLIRKAVWTSGCLIALAIGLSAVACGGKTSPAGLEERVAELETRLEQQQEAITTVAFAATTPRGSIFDAPLKRFFDAPEFWENVAVDAGACLARCAQERTEGVEVCALALDESGKLSPVDEDCIFVHASGPITTDSCAINCMNQSVPRVP